MFGAKYDKTEVMTKCPWCGLVVKFKVTRSGQMECRDCGTRYHTRGNTFELPPSGYEFRNKNHDKMPEE